MRALVRQTLEVGLAEPEIVPEIVPDPPFIVPKYISIKKHRNPSSKKQE